MNKFKNELNEINGLDSWEASSPRLSVAAQLQRGAI